MILDHKLKGKSGIYQIRNTTNGKIYIGRTNCFYRRLSNYFWAFKYRKTDEINSYLMSSMVKHGLDRFEFEVIEFCEPHLTPERECFWITSKNTLNRKIGYNLKIDLKGSIFTSEETKLKISKAISEKWRNPEFKSNMKIKLSKAWSRDPGRKTKHVIDSKKRNTKWKYLISFSDLKMGEFDYSDLRTMHLEGVYSRFSLRKKNKVYYRGYIIEKVSL